MTVDEETYVLGVDAGGTRTVCLLADSKQAILGRGQAGPGNMSAVGLAAGVAVVRAAVAQAWQAAGLSPRPAAVACLGVSGVDRPQEKQALADALAPYALAERLVIVTDAMIALAAGSPSGVGVVVIAGTGTIAWGRNHSGAVLRSGGWGYILGDEGSAFDIGLAGLRAVVRAHDGRAEPTALTIMILEQWQLQRPEELRAIVYKQPAVPRPEIAALAPVVERAARRGDAVAARIYAHAAEEMALAARAVIAGLGMQDEPVDVVLSGGVYQAGDLITLPFLSALRQFAPQALVTRLEQEPAIGAVHVAAAQAAAPNPIV
jgi:N-acetylglucosamine kinase-like BadF-type ATPase